MTTFHFQTHVSESGVITLPPDARNLYGKDVVVNVDLPSKPKPKRSLRELCGIWDNEEDCEDIDRMVAAIHEGRLLGREYVQYDKEEKTDQLPTSNESFEEFCARYDQIGISTKGWTFDREELYGDRL